MLEPTDGRGLRRGGTQRCLALAGPRSQNPCESRLATRHSRRVTASSMAFLIDTPAIRIGSNSLKISVRITSNRHKTGGPR